MAEKPHRKTFDKDTKVVALAAGFYRGQRFREGQVFTLRAGDRLGSWMDLPEKAKPKAVTADEPVALSQLGKGGAISFNEAMQRK